MFTETTALLASAHTHLVAAMNDEGDNRSEVARAEDDLQAVRHLIYRRPGQALASLSAREMLADNVITIIRVASQGHTRPYNRDRLYVAADLLAANGYTE